MVKGRRANEAGGRVALLFCLTLSRLSSNFCPRRLVPSHEHDRGEGAARSPATFNDLSTLPLRKYVHDLRLCLFGSLSNLLR